MLPSSASKIAHQDQSFVDHCDEAIRAAPPGVAIGDLFQEVRLFMEGLAADLDIHAEVGADIERRVDVDELRPPASSIGWRSAPALSEERISLLSPQISLLVQPLSWRPRAIEQLRSVRLGFLARLVDVFERLERQDGGADIAGLAVPDQLDLALVLEEDEAVFLRQGFALLDQSDQVALFGVAQLVGFLRARAIFSPPDIRGRRSRDPRTMSAGALETFLINVDEAIFRSRLRLCSQRWRPRTIAEAAHFLRHVQFFPALGLDDPDLAILGSHDEIRSVGGKLAVGLHIVELEANRHVVLGERRQRRGSCCPETRQIPAPGRPPCLRRRSC